FRRVLFRSGFEPGDGAAASADGVDVDNAHEHRQTFKVGLRGDVRLAVNHQGNVKGCSAHVHTGEVAVSRDTCQFDVAHGAADRAGKQRLQRPLTSGFGGEYTAGGLHDVQWGFHSPVSEFVFQVQKVVAYDRTRVGLDDGRGRALVFAPFLGCFVR